MVQQWYVNRAGQNFGPYTWDELCHYAREGNITEDDLLWSQSTGAWIKAGQIASLVTHAFAKDNIPPKTHRKKRPFIAVASILTILLLAFVLFVINTDILPLFRESYSLEKVVDVGTYAIKEPSLKHIVEIDDWGHIPANQIAILLRDNFGEEEAQRIAKKFDGNVVGHIQMINMYQIETKGTSEDDLRYVLSAAEKMESIEVVAPNIPVTSRMTIEGRKCSPLNDPMYAEGDNGRVYEMIGLQNAWDIISATGVTLNKARVGVIDDIIYTQSGHTFTPELHFPDEQGRYADGRVRITPIKSDRDKTSTPITDASGELRTGGLGHGTAVTHVISADASGGTVGVASILGENLQVTVNVTGRGTTFVGQTDANDLTDPVRWGNHTYGMLEHMLEQVESGATIINCSWGPQFLGSQNATASAMMNRFLTIMAERHPEVIFVTAAGNSGQGLNGTNDYWGKNLPNLITVGALNNDGERASAKDWYNQEQLKAWYQNALANQRIPATKTFDQYVDSLLTGSNYADAGGEVTLSAPGTDVPVGISPNGKTLTSNGTSFASPMVTGTIALMKAINPKLTAAEIKEILTQTASRKVKSDGNEKTVPDNMGAGVLRADQAVLKVINDMRAGDPNEADYPLLPPLDFQTLLGLADIKITATLVESENHSKEWVVTASVSEVSESGTTVEIKTIGQGMVIGNKKQQLNAPGKISWTVKPVHEYFTVRAYRLDTGACAILHINEVEEDIIDGTYTGYFTVKEDEKIRNYIVDIFSKMITPIIRAIGSQFDVTYSDEEIRDAVDQATTSEALGKSFAMNLTIISENNNMVSIHAYVIDVDGQKTEYSTKGTYEGGILKFKMRSNDGTIMEMTGRMVNADTLEGEFTATALLVVKDAFSGSWSVEKK